MKQLCLFILILGISATVLWAENRTPTIGIEGGLVQNFGSQYLGYAANPRSIQINNTGNTPLSIQSIDVPNGESAFVLINPPMPMNIPAGGSNLFWMVFMPTHLGTESDSLFICSDDPINPSLKVRLTGTGIYVPPAAVQNIQINTVGEDITLTWDAVTTTIFGLPLNPDRYVVLFSQQSAGEQYWTLAVTTQLTYTHLGVVTFAPSMFYRVKAVVFYRNEDAIRLDRLVESKAQFSEREIDKLLDSFLRP
jgi:hypothetical protein